MELIKKSTVILEEMANKRLDQVLALLFSEYSRSVLKQWLLAGYIKVDGEILKPRDKAKAFAKVELEAPVEVQCSSCAQDIPLDIVYEDDEIMIVNKPAGLVVHPGAGNMHGTLLNALLHHDSNLENIPRAGIVHRLDKDTSGLLVIAKTLAAHHDLIKQLQTKSMGREYEAIVYGEMTAGFSVDKSIGRHKTNRVKMAVLEHGGKEAQTLVRVLKRFRGFTKIKAILQTGRTHQIRVHMAYMGYPLVGDATYGGRLRLPKGADDELIAALRNFTRQALHARKLGLTHPRSGEHMEWVVPAPEDMLELESLIETKMGINS